MNFFWRAFASIALLTLLFTSCAPSEFTEEPAGFFAGLWHGLIIFLSVLGKLFGFDVGIHAVHNTGWPYWLGYVIGLSTTLGGSNHAGRRKRKS